LEIRIMSTAFLLCSSDFYQPLKAASCLIIAVFAASLTGCGVSTPSGYVFGTTGYLEEFNRGKLSEVSPAERQRLSRLIEEVK
jgi:hypothetical protein